MTKRVTVNLIAALVIAMAGASIGMASEARPARQLMACSGGGGTCTCDAGQTCYSNSSGCACGK